MRDSSISENQFSVFRNRQRRSGRLARLADSNSLYRKRSAGNVQRHTAIAGKRIRGLRQHHAGNGQRRFRAPFPQKQRSIFVVSPIVAPRNHELRAGQNTERARHVGIGVPHLHPRGDDGRRAGSVADVHRCRRIRAGVLDGRQGHCRRSIYDVDCRASIDD